MSISETPNSLEGIAIIGMAGGFPGAKSIEKFWQNIRDGVESITVSLFGVNPIIIVIGSILAIFALILITMMSSYFLKRILLKKKRKLIWTPISSIERRSNLSSDEFIKEYASIGKPVIITDVVKNWKASTKWTLDFFREKYGPVKTDGVRDRNNGTNISMTVADYMDYLETGDSEQSLYLFDFYMFEHPELYEDFEIPVYCQKNLLEILPEKLFAKYFRQYLYLIIGRKESSIGLHTDAFFTQGWLAAIYGRKRFILIPPDKQEFVYDGEVDAFNPDLEKFPLYANAKPVEFILSPGELLYIPCMWWHQAENLENTIAWGVNTVNELNFEMVVHAASEVNPIIANLLGFLLEFPWLGRVIFANID
ncbi:cupin-like domain-containing protein [Nostoc sp. NMS9]|uniref:cupin-like domain-containing protein n=1 Tax=Nostoc sp. NMS9 TaxID=2815393 RepID=UPI0025FFF7D3|nr:cupin-like domain-containing protein [Nostoc sp. NMS9]MBN3942867.1 cupin-like domain-containing protein [Nostoc sp. NMS9]